MRTVHEWLHDYGVSHQNPTNKLIHWFCVPLIFLSIVGLLASIPTPEFMDQLSPYLNFGSLLLVLGMIYYCFLSIPLAIGMSIFSVITFAIVHWIGAWNIALWKTSLTIFIVAWVVQFIGHEIEGKKPSFFKDLQFLMIGPIWLLSFLFKKMGIKY